MLLLLLTPFLPPLTHRSLSLITSPFNHINLHHKLQKSLTQNHFDYIKMSLSCLQTITFCHSILSIQSLFHSKLPTTFVAFYIIPRVTTFNFASVNIFTMHNRCIYYTGCFEFCYKKVPHFVRSCHSDANKFTTQQTAFILCIW